MLRASEACERAGFPTSSLVCEGFLGQAAATSVGLGMPNLPVAMIPGHPGAQSLAELRANVHNVTAQQVIDNLLRQPAEKEIAPEPAARDIVFRGTFEEVNAYFYEREWSDGLPIVPPTIEKIEEFLSFTDRAPEESLGILLPENRAATIWAVAVNGVMAGCRPEYMPILVALAEAMADPVYGVEHSGNTPGSETLIILNGPIIKDLNFNYTQGVLRDGFMPNTSVGRFWRLALRNMAGFLLHKTDKGTFGNTFRVVLAENEDALARIGWPPNSVDMGFAAGDNTVTISRFTGGGVIVSVTGSTPEQMMPYIADGVAKETGWEIVFTVGGLTSEHCVRCSCSARSWRKRLRAPVGPRTTSSVTCSTMRVCPHGALRPGPKSGRTSRSARSSSRSISDAFRRLSMNRMIRTGWCRSCSNPTTSWCWCPATHCGPTPTPSPRTAISAFRQRRR